MEVSTTVVAIKRDECQDKIGRMKESGRGQRSFFHSHRSPVMFEHTCSCVSIEAGYLLHAILPTHESTDKIGLYSRCSSQGLSTSWITGDRLWAFAFESLEALLPLSQMPPALNFSLRCICIHRVETFLFGFSSCRTLSRNC